MFFYAEYSAEQLAAANNKDMHRAFMRSPRSPYLMGAAVANASCSIRSESTNCLIHSQPLADNVFETRGFSSIIFYSNLCSNQLRIAFLVD